MQGRIARSTTHEQIEETETLLRLIELGWARVAVKLQTLLSQSLFRGAFDGNAIAARAASIRVTANGICG